MIRTILVPTSGSDIDQNVFETALAVARPLDAHLEFYHIWVSPAQAVIYAMPFGELAMGNNFAETFDGLQQRAESRSATAKLHFDQFCARHQIPVIDVPRRSSGVTASWLEEVDDAPQRLMERARHRDLIVMGRTGGNDGLPQDFLETLLLGCGRPTIIAPPVPSGKDIQSIGICWKEAPEAARAITAAMPLLYKAKLVTLLSADEGPGIETAALEDLAQPFEWHGISVEIKTVSTTGRSVADALLAGARDMDLLVMGGYGRGRTQEFIFGSVTNAVIKAATLPVLVLH